MMSANPSSLTNRPPIFGTPLPITWAFHGLAGAKALKFRFPFMTPDGADSKSFLATVRYLKQTIQPLVVDQGLPGG
jgi:hypothetical protein